MNQYRIMGKVEQITTPLYEQLISRFEDLNETKRPGLSALRNEAFEVFKAKGFPTVKDEDWKFTNIKPFLAASYQFDTYEPAESQLDAAINNGLIPELDAYLLVLLNGVLQPQKSILPEATNIVVSPINLVDDHILATHAEDLPYKTNSLVALNLALSQDGYFIEVPRGVTLDKPIHILHIYSTTDHVLYQPQHLVIVNELAKAELIETTVVLDDAHLVLVNSVTNVVVKQNAQLIQYNLLDNLANERILNYTTVKQERDSRYDNFNFCLPGAPLIRNTLEIELNGTATETHLLGLYLVGDHQLTDNHTAIHHMYPNCNSNEIYKGVLLDSGKAVFNGKVFVERAAQKTNAFQQNNNLLLSDNAQVFAKPQLEIYADDVKCSHGCTVGQFDPESLFYLRSRGISEDSARKLLVEAFMFDVTQKIQNEPLKEYIQATIYSKMVVLSSID